MIEPLDITIEVDGEALQALKNKMNEVVEEINKLKTHYHEEVNGSRDTSEPRYNDDAEL